MRLAFHGATTMTSDLQTDVAATAHAGYKALELWAAKVDRYLEDHSVEQLKALLDDNNVAPMTFNSIEFIAFRGNEFDQIKARCRQLSQIAQVIGCPSVAVIPSPTPAWDTPWDTVVAEHVAALQDLSDISREYGIKLAFEFIGFGGFSVRTPRGAWEIIQKTGRDNIGMVVDAAHLYVGGGLPSEIDQLDPKYIYAFHLDDTEEMAKEAYTDAVRLLPGLGVIPLDDICARLKGIGYNGACSIELFRPEYWEWDPKELAVKARELAVKVLSPYFEVE
ncbi:MAG: sugar phosphate isomerase/epimerase [Anaerolineae bacterium]|nr:sugar phosphate isomerase/epimerase [Anaerolineae bacterium]